MKQNKSLYVCSILQEDIKSLTAHVIENYWKALEDVDYVQTFKGPGNTFRYSLLHNSLDHTAECLFYHKEILCCDPAGQTTSVHWRNNTLQFNHITTNIEVGFWFLECLTVKVKYFLNENRKPGKFAYLHYYSDTFDCI